MAWVTWRQHRSQLVAGLALLVGLAATALATHLPIHAAYHRDAVAGCLPPSARAGCDLIVRHFESEFGGWAAAARGLAVLPALVGLFVGAPLLARELEHGTHRFAWTQAVTRRRWLLSKTAFLALGTVAAAALASALTMWWRSPFDTLEGRMTPRGFDIEGLVVPAYALFALAVGVLAGLVLRRTVAAMSVTLIVFAATRLAVLKFLRPHFLAALHRTVVATDSGRGVGDWVLSDTLVDAGGQNITAGARGPRDPARAAGGHRPARVPRHARLAAHDLLPAGRRASGRSSCSRRASSSCWRSLVIAAAVWFVRRTPA